MDWHYNAFEARRKLCRGLSRLHPPKEDQNQTQLRNMLRYCKIEVKAARHLLMSPELRECDVTETMAYLNKAQRGIEERNNAITEYETKRLIMLVSQFIYYGLLELDLAMFREIPNCLDNPTAEDYEKFNLDLLPLEDERNRLSAARKLALQRAQTISRELQRERDKNKTAHGGKGFEIRPRKMDDQEETNRG